MAMDIYSRITDKIITDLEKGDRTWMKPWNAEHAYASGKITRPLRFNGLPYSGINVLNLWSEAVDKDFSAPIWMTYRQAQELGGHVRKGQQGSLVVYANTITKTGQNEETGEDEEHTIPFMKGYTVFNVEQIDQLPPQYYAKAEAPTLTETQRNEQLDAYFRATQADIRHGGNQAFYAISQDFIQMPPFEFFKDPESYYATQAHELTHWTRHPTRLDRDLGRKKWGDEGYAFEELVAELGSAFLCADLGITPEVREDHAAYIASWLKVLKNDKRAIFSAAAHAQRAATFLNDLQPQPAPEPAAAHKATTEQSTEPPSTGKEQHHATLDY